MSKHLLVVGLLAAAAIAAGCTGSMNASVSPTLPGASGSPSPNATPATGASTTPAVSASAGVGASTAPVASNLDATMAAIYKAGRKWTYEVLVDAAGQKSTQAFTREVTKIEDGKAWIKQVNTFNGKTSESTDAVDLTKKVDAAAMITKSTSADGTVTEYIWTQKSEGKEEFSGKAGKFASTKYTGTLVAKGTASGTSASNGQDTSFWVSDTVGLLKSTSSGSQTVSAAGQSFTTTFSSTLELVSVTP